MTPNASKFRLWFYVSTSMLSAFTGGVMALETGDWRNVAVFVAGILGAGLTGARGYLDQSVSQVVEDVKQTIDFKKFPPMP